MKLKLFHIRNFPILLMLSLTLVFEGLSLVMHFLNTAETGFDFPWMLFADELIPLMLFLPALILRSRGCALAAVLTAFLNIFLRCSEVIIFYKTFMPFEYSTLKLFLIHSHFIALQAVMGKYFLFWLIPLCLATASVVVYCCILVWKTADKISQQFTRRLLPVFSVLLGLSLSVNLIYLIIQQFSPALFANVRPLPQIVLSITEKAFVELYFQKDCTPIPLPEESRRTLTELQVLASEDEKPLEQQDCFDRIIIIAMESLDYAFLSRNNPAMPSGITPNLDKLSAEYFSMNNYFSAAQPTSWGLNSILLSRLDYAKDKYMLPESMFTMAKKQGFQTFYFSAATGLLDENNIAYKILFSPEIQFFREEFLEKYGGKIENQWGLSDRTLYKSVLNELKQTSAEKFIALISTIDTHNPYHNTLPDDYEKETFNTPFLRALHSSDKELGCFISKIMQDKKLYNKRTLIIVTADHTATHGENFTKRKDFFPERIPLILITPQKKLFRKLNTEKYASSIDLAPTLLRLIGSDIPETFMGRDLFSPKNIAITRLMNNTLNLHSPSRSFSVSPKPDKQNLSNQHWRDFYSCFYGKL